MIGVRTAIRRFTRPVVRTVAGGGRAAAGTAFAAGYILFQSARGRTVCVLIAVSGRVSRTSVLCAARLAAAFRVRCPVLVVDQLPTYEDRKAVGALLAALPVRRFWHEGASQAGGAQAGGAQPRHDTDGFTAGPVPDPGTGAWVPGYYRDGKPVLAIGHRADAAVVYHYGVNGFPVCRDEWDKRGKLVRIVDLDPAAGHDVRYRYIGADGQCWLSLTVDGMNGTFKQAVRHQPVTVEFPSLQAAQARWVTEELAPVRAARLLVAEQNSGDLGQQLGHPYATINDHGLLHRHATKPQG